MEDRHLSLSEVAGLMGVSERTVRRWIKSGKLRAYKPGRDYRIPETAVRAFVEDSEISPKAFRRSSLEPTLFNGLEGERREAIYDVVLAAARRQAKQNRQAAARAIESERPQAYFMRHENEAMHRLLEYPAGELADGLIEMANQLVQLEETQKAQSEATYGPWREAINRYAGRWEQRIEAGDFNMADVNEFIATLEDLGPTLNRLGLQEKREQPAGYMFTFGPIMGEVIQRLMDLLNPLIEAGVAKFDNSEIEQLRRKRAEQEAALGEPVRRGA